MFLFTLSAYEKLLTQIFAKISPSTESLSSQLLTPVVTTWKQTFYKFDKIWKKIFTQSIL